MSRRRPYLARTTTLHTRRQRRRYVMTLRETVEPTSHPLITCIYCRINIEWKHNASQSSFHILHYLNFGAVFETIMELLKLKKRRSAQKSVIASQITKLAETDETDHFQAIMKSLQTKYSAMEQLNENILSFTNEDDYETEMVDAELFMLDLKLKLQDFPKKMSTSADIPPPLLHPEETLLGQQPSKRSQQPCFRR